MTVPFWRRYPHALAGALCLGLGAACVVRAASWVVAVAAVAAAAAAAVVRERHRFALVALALLLGGWWWASVRLDDLDRSALAGEVGETAVAFVDVAGPARRGTFALRVRAEVRRFGSRVVSEPVLLELPLGRAPPQGAILRLVARVERPRPSSDDGFDEREWLRRQGIQVVVHGTSWRVVGRRGGVAGAGDALRARLARTVAPGMTGERRGVVAGVVLGEDEGLSDGLRDAFRASGLYHLLAVSGQNVAFLAAGVLGLVWLLGLSRAVGQAAVIVAIAAYVLAVGWQPSVVRAGVAGGLASLAWLASRPRDRWYFMLAGAIVLLAWNPYSLLEPGFQLSFAAVAAIFVAVPRLRRALDGYPVPRLLADAVAVSAACGLVTAPILWIQFGSVPVYSVLSNALAAPAVGPLLGIALATAGVDAVAPSAAAVLAWANGWLAAYIAGCARAVAALPFSEVSSGVAVAGLLAAPILILALARVAPWRRRRLGAALALAAVAAAMWLLWPERVPPPPSGLRISFLDVGQGDAVLVEVPQGGILIDQGPPEAHVARQLKALGVRRLALLVLTHPQRDHVGGAAEVLERVPVDVALDPALHARSADHTMALRTARARGVRVEVARAGAAYRLGRLLLRVLWPKDAGSPADDPNERATVIHATYGEVDALLTADAESPVTLPLRPPRAEILKVAHHGSADAGLARLLAAVRPNVAVISVGAQNDYGHPAPSTLATLAAARGVAVYRTDRNGRVVVESDGRGLTVRKEH